MGVTNYINLGSTIIAEESVGGSRTNYATDALGSVTGTLVGGALLNTYSYKPYGSLLQKSGGGADPSFTWNGGGGYKSTSRAFADIYVRARSYASYLGRWTSKDSYWPQQQQFTYVNSNPGTKNDPTGNGLPGEISNPKTVKIGQVDLARVNDMWPFAGLTGCDIGFGTIWMIIPFVSSTDDGVFIPGLWDVVKPCLLAHENVHASQFSSCCHACSLEYQKTFRLEALEYWRDQFYGWVDNQANVDAEEPPAYKAEWNCFVNAYTAHQCNGPIPPPHSLCWGIAQWRDSAYQASVSNKPLSDCPAPSHKYYAPREPKF